MNVVEAGGDLIRDGWGRFRRAWGWFAGEYVGLAVLIALGILWTRIPEKHGWQVALTLLLPVVVMAAFFWLQAGYIRGFLQPAVAVEETHDEKQPAWAPIVWGATTLVLWLVIGWLVWAAIDQLDAHTYQWAAVLNAKLSPHARATWGNYSKLDRDFEWGLWVLRWVIVPGLLIPLAVGSAAWGVLRLPWRRVLRVWTSWKWWPLVLICALLGEAWPQTWFESNPYGTVRAQIWRVVLKLIGAYLLGVTAWVKVLAWGAMLVNPRPRTRMDEDFLTLGINAQANETPKNDPLPASEHNDVAAPPSGAVPSQDLHAPEPPPSPASAASEEAAHPPAEEHGSGGRPLPRGPENVNGHA